MPVRRLASLGLAAALAGSAAACGPKIDLARALVLTDVATGWYDNGLKDGAHHMLPSVTFRVRNAGAADLRSLQLTVQFWRDGDSGEWESRLFSGVAVAAGAETDPTLVRAERGYTLENSDIGDLFQHSQFTDFAVHIYVRRSSQITRIGEYKVERRILPATRDSGRP
jgi:hypothetical protein